jgi:uncharacterized BrkB/YihY/UPF0761 family membrane protein
MVLSLLASNKYHIHNHFFFFFFFFFFFLACYSFIPAPCTAKRQIIEGTFRTAVAT